MTRLPAVVVNIAPAAATARSLRAAEGVPSVVEVDRGGDENQDIRRDMHIR